MYTPSHFAADDETRERFLAQVRAGDLITDTEQGLVATFLPLLYESDGGPQGVLLGHVARSNDQWKLPVRGEALAIVHGPDAYISPSWYASKAAHGRVV